MKNLKKYYTEGIDVMTTLAGPLIVMTCITALSALWVMS